MPADVAASGRTAEVTELVIKGTEEIDAGGSGRAAFEGRVPPASEQ